MRLFLFALIVSILFFTSCREDILEFPEVESTGKIYIDSNPRDADIYINGMFSNRISPDSLVNLEPGDYIISLRKRGYKDTSVIVEVEKGGHPFISILLKEEEW